MRRYPLFKFALIVSALVLSIPFLAGAVFAADKAWARYKQAVVRVTVSGNTANGSPTYKGTGVIVSSKGYILTTMHTLREDTEWEPDLSGNLRSISIELRGENGTFMPPVAAKLVARDDDHDAALLIIDGENFKAARCSFVGADVGDVLTLIGYPKYSTTADNYSGKVQPSDKAVLGERYRIAMPTKQGHSGSPVFNQKSQVVAIVTSGLDDVGSAESSETYAMPLSAFQSILSKDITCGTAESPNALQAIRDCPECPEMIFIPTGKFKMGSVPTIPFPDKDSQPQHEVVVDGSFAIARTETTRGQFLQCIAAGACQENQPDMHNAELSRYPVTFVNRQDALDFSSWLSSRTGQVYRLPSEAEWEYAARAGTLSAYPWGPEVGTGNAGCWGCGGDLDGSKIKSALPVGRFPANNFRLYDMIGNVSEFVEDCWFPDHTGAPQDTLPRISTRCTDYVIKGGSWMDPIMGVRVFKRFPYLGGTDRSQGMGFRVVRDVN